MQTQHPTFRRMNTLLGILHLVLGLGFGLYFYHLRSRATTPIDLSVRDHSLTYEKEYESVVVVDPSIASIEILVVLFFLITACFHLLYSWTATGLYRRMINSKNNWIRWIEYALTSTLMIYIIAFLSGVKDLNTIILLGFVNVCMILQGQSIETNLANGTSAFLPYLTGFLLLVAEFSVIIKDFFRRVGESEALVGQKPPRWLYAMIFILLLFFSLFGIVSACSGAFHWSYPTTEKTYLWLSLVSKATLGAFIAYGLGQRSTMGAPPSPSPSDPSLSE